MKAILFKQTLNGRYHVQTIDALTDEHAVELAYQRYNRHGLIGRYYLETASGKTFTISA